MAPVTPKTAGFVDQPVFGDQMHIVAVVLDGTKLDSLSEKITDQLQTARAQAHARGIRKSNVNTKCYLKTI